MQISNDTNSIYQLSSNDEQFSQKTEQSTRFENVMETVSQQAVGDTDGSIGEMLAMDTNQGHSKINLDEYSTPKAHSGPVDLKDIPLLLPTAHNIDTLSKYSEAKFKNLLQHYNIPSPPATIEFDGEGKLVIPSDYPHAAELRKALEDNPGTENALRTTAALASHYAGIMEGADFRDEMSTARSQVDQDRIVQKYSYLFDDNRSQAQIVLAFLDDGSMLVGEKNA
jgi:hypothetical protein